jgi:hypothetical protein
MFGRLLISRSLIGAAILAAVACVTLATLQIASSTPAQAQGFLQNLFRPIFPGGNYQRRRRAPRNLWGPRTRREPRAHRSLAPPPRKAKEGAPPAITILVMGDGMADWLGYGLESAFSESPDVGIVRENKRRSGLIQYERKSDVDWWHHAREYIAKNRADYVVMMLGINDRESIRERDVLAKARQEAEEKKKQAEEALQRALENAPGGAGAGESGQAENADRKKTAEEKPKKRKSSNATFEFRGNRWEKVYVRRIDRTIAALKSKGVPVFWVGLPAVRGTRSTADVVYLNDLYRARAERAGIVYVDVWDGFVKESGRYSSFGPDLEGQTRRLRSSDGVFFTKHGARKLAHYVERAIRRFMINRNVPVALPTGPLGPLPGGEPGARPVAGPVVPLTVPPVSNAVLAGAPGRHRVHGDTIARDALVRGEPLDGPAGRADDFSWPPGSGAGKPSSPPARAKPKQAMRPETSGVRDVTPLATVPKASPTIAPLPPEPPATATAPAAPESKPGAAAQDAASDGGDDAASANQAEARPAQDRAQRPVRRRARSPLDALFGRNGPFGWIPR